MNQGSSRESVRRLKSWHFGILMFAFYMFWGGFFTDVVSIPGQIVFNFAVFYPAGFLAGYFKTRSRLRDVYVTGFIFNVLTYVLAVALGEVIKPELVLIDFLSMAVCIYLGIMMGNRAASGKETA